MNRSDLHPPEFIAARHPLLVCGFFLAASFATITNVAIGDEFGASQDQASQSLPLWHFQAGHHLEGLPNPEASKRAYSDSPDDVWNRIHALLFYSELIPEEIQGTLPEERVGVESGELFNPGWYFNKRAGKKPDTKLFGGDVRISPRRSFTKSERDELMALLEEVNRSGNTSDQPIVKLLKQWDLLSVWWTLERIQYSDQELLHALSHAVVSLAQPRGTLLNLRSGEESLARFQGGTTDRTDAPYFPEGFELHSLTSDDSDWIELDRKSSALFQANKSLRSTRVFIRLGSRERGLQTLAALQSKHEAGSLPHYDRGEDGRSEIEVPAGTLTMLVQQMIGIDDQMGSVVTPVIDEVRVRGVVGEAKLAADNHTSSRDGSSHWVYQRTREGTRRDGENDFRFIPDTSQALFLEYGTFKHATYAAQCALCHRRTHSGGQAPEGIRSFSKYAAPSVAIAGARAKLAEAEMQEVVSKLADRFNSRPAPPTSGEDAPGGVKGDTTDESALSTSRLPPRPKLTEEERTELARKLRTIYSVDQRLWPAPHVDEGVAWKEVGLLPSVEHPDENPHNASKELLGKTLFFDPRISGSQQIACASCHDPDLAWADGRTTSFGHGRTKLARNSPTIRNVGLHSSLFWDGRSESLEDQVIAVLNNPNEMRTSAETAKSLISGSDRYQIMFQESFGDSDVTIQRIAEAIACFERTVVGGSSRFDTFLKGKKEALTDSEILGLDLFRREARCMNCHHGPMFADGLFHDVGLSYYGRELEDLGRYEHTGNNEDVGKFRTPSLRDVTKTNPLMHNGLFELSGVLNMYNAGMPTLKRKASQRDDERFPTKSIHLRSLGLNQDDLEDIANFLATLEEPKRRVAPPPLPEVVSDANQYLWLLRKTAEGWTELHGDGINLSASD